MSKARLNRLRGVEHHDRIDEELYHDFESEEARKVCITCSGTAAWGGRCC